ncbi:hypothetical protein GMLC_04190 [Geomonas limicola]|uniref:Lipoprotein n=1 Tax=Geomonas limicola TaxID=2740186 RepID=A0A6V8N3A2_9BACT|nr:hypothetical protein [Geomonas limicola]GFO66840.1 hypothetical protein GMLC_04190 [Geomonas limicola]
MNQLPDTWIYLCRVVAMAGLLTGAVPAFAANPLPAAAQRVYHPSASYPGPYRVDVVYMRARDIDPWAPGIAGRFPAVVTCPDALQKLRSTGYWSGHLKKGGACGTPYEPSSWALGNRLNYDAQQAPAPVNP